MNILIPHNWLLDHLETKANPEQVAKYLSLCGPSIERIEHVNGEPVYDIEVTTNRVDSMSVRGIAREAAVILPEFNIPAKLKPLPEFSKITNTKTLDLKIQNDPKLCHRILAVKLENITLGPSQKLLQQRLEQVGQRSLNNIIDITNYVMWEIGHPIHAFDYDRIINKTIIVRESKAGETLITLDGVKHKLKGGEVIFDDGTGNIIDLPGIMGTQNTVVTDKTKNVLLWIESIDAVKIRQASMSLSIRTQAAVLNEKNVDSELGLTAINRAVQLAREIAKAQIGSQLTDIYPNPSYTKSTELHQSQIDLYLGLHAEPKRIQRILENLGCTVKQTNSHRPSAISYAVIPPTSRTHDLQIPQDYIEEIARIYGYHKLPSVVMDTSIPDNPPEENFHLEHQIKTWLADWGLQEVYTYSLVSRKLAEQSDYQLESHLKLSNPLNDEWMYMRRSLIPSHLQVVEQNKNLDEISIFEISNVYEPKFSQANNSPATENLHLLITTTKDFSYLKGLLSALFSRLYLSPNIANFSSSETLFGSHFGGNVVVESANNKSQQVLGKIVKLSRKQQICILQLDVTGLIKLAQSHPTSIRQSNYPSFIEDMTFTFLPQTSIGPVIQLIKVQSNLIKSVGLTDKYNDSFTFKITYQSNSRNLSSKDVQPLRIKITKAVGKKFKAKLKGQV